MSGTKEANENNGIANGYLKKFNNGWNGLSRIKKVLLFAIIISLLLSVAIYYLAFGKTSYSVLYTNLNMQDLSEIVKKLDESKITDYKIEDSGKTLLVSSKEVDRIRINLAIDGVTPNNGNGYEIFDDKDFAMTDEDRKIKYQRALEGELQRTIISLKEVNYARVHLVLAEDSIFAKETEPASASVILELNNFRDISKEKVKGIMSLVSGAVKNLPLENVTVIDTNSNLLSEGIVDDGSSSNVNIDINDRMQYKASLEKSINDKVQSMLEKALGYKKVIVSVAANIDFTSTEKTTITYDKEGVLRSEHKSETKNETTGGSNDGQSPIDDNMQNEIDEDGSSKGSSTSTDETKNYEIGEKREHVVILPGELRSISTSVIIDDKDLSDAKKAAISNIVKAATGFSQARGDIISIEAMEFDTSYQDMLKDSIDSTKPTGETPVNPSILEKILENKLYLYGGIGLLLILLITLMIIGRNKRKKKVNTEVIPLYPNNRNEKYPIQQEIAATAEDLFDNNPNTDEYKPNDDVKLNKFKLKTKPQDKTVESIKDLAVEEPDAIADLIKVWLGEDEKLGIDSGGA